MMEFVDQTGRTVELAAYPRRIVSLVPSQTELLFDLGLDEEIVGVTDYCVLPEDKVADRVKVGGPKTLCYPVIDRLHPDLIIGNWEENYREGIQRLREKHPVWLSDVASVEDALSMIATVGALVNRNESADRLTAEIRSALQVSETYPSMHVAYLVWKHPHMAAGGQTFINAMLANAGFVNVLASRPGYPIVSPHELDEAQIILLSSEPYPFTLEDVEELSDRYPAGVVHLVDGTMFSWYGSRMKYALSYFKGLREALNMSS